MVAQSHAVVENLFGDVIAAGVDGTRVGKKLNTVNTGWTDITNPEFAGFIAEHDGCVIGGTAWDFANDNKIPRLAAWICWSSRRPASTAWPTPSPWPRRPGT